MSAITSKQKTSFVVKGRVGEKYLNGSVSISGAKNAALPALAASILFDDEISYNSIPFIDDIQVFMEILSSLGADIKKTNDGASVSFGGKMPKSVIDPSAMCALRGSIILTGPLLARTGRVVFSSPMGCPIGKRPIDFFIDGFKSFGADITIKENGGIEYVVTAPKGGLVGTEIFMRHMSVTATETLIFTALLAKGTTVLKNCAIEPEVSHLVEFLNKCGAVITGAGTPTITIEGGSLLKASGKSYTLPADRVEAGSFLMLGILAAENLEITNCNPEHLESLIDTLRRSGANNFEVTKNSFIIKKEDRKKVLPASYPINIQTHEYPGFPTDLQSIIAVYASQLKGRSFIFESIFEDRFRYLDYLKKFGVRFNMINRREIEIDGPTKLNGSVITKVPDLRAGFALITAAAIAEGETVIRDLKHVNRGYEDLEKKLRGIGLDIIRE
ncbi:MAG: UDP-N-acetylglucosamine 1-carboxyvinyltransferase [Candidatus Campbellbacteria bacterium]|nr:UDP-N-acetylglucosamine 1-carboxyvinyltransferase [Candidatus Campbellbacteria bacterium]